MIISSSDFIYMDVQNGELGGVYVLKKTAKRSFGSKFSMKSEKTLAVANFSLIGWSANGYHLYSTEINGERFVAMVQSTRVLNSTHLTPGSLPLTRSEELDRIDDEIASVLRSKEETKLRQIVKTSREVWGDLH